MIHETTRKHHGQYSTIIKEYPENAADYILDFIGGFKCRRIDKLAKLYSRDPFLNNIDFQVFDESYVRNKPALYRAFKTLDFVDVEPLEYDNACALKFILVFNVLKCEPVFVTELRVLGWKNNPNIKIKSEGEIAELKVAAAKKRLDLHTMNPLDLYGDKNHYYS